MKKNLTIQCRNKTLRCVFPIIVFEDEPILMVLQDEFNDLFLCLCSEFRDMYRWIVAPTRIEVLRRLLDFELTINDALRAVSRFAYVIERHGREFSDYRVAFDSIDPFYLAVEGVYADFMEDDCEDNLALLEAEQSKIEEDYYIANVARLVSDSPLPFLIDPSASKKDEKASFIQAAYVEPGLQLQCAVHGVMRSGMPDKNDPHSFAA